MQQTNVNASGFNGVSVGAADSQPDSQPASSAQLGNLDLRIELGFMETTYYGTSEQLTAEGLIPDGFEWPNARDRTGWVAGKQDFYLMRCRPPRHKGLMRTWLETDWWCLRVNLVDRPDAYGIAEARKRAELAALTRELCADACIARREIERRWFGALRDSSFQIFKERVPGLSVSRQGRRKRADASDRG